MAMDYHAKICRAVLVNLNILQINGQIAQAFTRSRKNGVT